MPEIKNPQRLFFLGLFTAMLLLTARLFAPFFTTLMWAAFFYLALGPLYHKIIDKIAKAGLKGALFYNIRNLIAALLAFAAMAIAAVPLSFLSVEMFKQLSVLANGLRAYLAGGPAAADLARLETAVKAAGFDFFDISSIDWRKQALSALDSLKISLAGAAYVAVGGVSSFVISFFFMVFSLFFFFVDGKRLLGMLVAAVPIKNDYSIAFINRFKETGIGLLRGFFLTALIQGGLAFIVFSFFKVKGALAFAALTSIASFVPIFGAGLVWGPLALMHAAQHGPTAGLFFLGAAAVSISLPDNFIRPFLLGNRINIHPLLIFFSILGGLRFYGINGLAIGPLTLVLFFTCLELFERETKNALPRDWSGRV